jgi:hypothetical protein
VKYTSDDIRKYVEGSLTPAEMNAMERAALTDPFLSDAMEGMIAFAGGTSKFSADSELLKNRLRKRMNITNKRLAIAYGMVWKVAAILIVIASGVAIVFYSVEKNDVRPETLAKAEKGTYSTPATIDSSRPKSENAAAAIVTRDTFPKMKTASKKSRSKTEAPVYNETSSKSTAVNDAASMEEVKKEDVAAVASGQRSPQAYGTVHDSSSNARESRALSRKVAGIATHEESSEDSLASAIPKAGWNEFYRYIRDNKRKTDSSAAPIVMSFDVNRRGRATSIKVLSRVAPDIEAEAVRLISEGPKWKIPRGGSKRVSISFSLE